MQRTVPNTIGKSSFYPVRSGEHIAGAAVKDSETGVIYVADWHEATAVRMPPGIGDLYRAGRHGKSDRFLEGFVTETGKFVDRVEGAAICRRAKQYHQDRNAIELDAMDVTAGTLGGAKTPSAIYPTIFYKKRH